MKLAFDIAFEDLYQLAGLNKIQQAFLSYLEKCDFELYSYYQQAKHNHLVNKEYSNFITKLAPILDDFIAELFNINQENLKLRNKDNELSILYHIKRQFIQRKALRALKKEELEQVNIEQVKSDLKRIYNYSLDDLNELQFAIHINKWLEEDNQDALNLAKIYSCWRLHFLPKLKNSDILFTQPKKLNFDNLLNLDGKTDIIQYPNDRINNRNGFNLTDAGASREFIQDQANYCIYCHNQEKDSCSKGLKDKEGNFKTNYAATELSGCPLDEKISEMNYLKAHGYSIGALATAIIDNPMLAATGHRICNDCMKSCIYQKQEPVNIPEIETGILRNILALPYGFEIYSLLIKWNPLKLNNYLPKTDSNKNILIAGMGPAGFTLAHYLLNEGHNIIALDGLKIEKLPPELVDENFQPIKNYNKLEQNLADRVPQGFGGVAEYGITVRWDKNFLSIIYLLLARRKNFNLISGARLGSNLTIKQAFSDYNIDHIALCLGAGQPNILNIENALAKGVKTSSDFLMNLQLSDVSKVDSLANLTIRLPVIVIGGGLTAVDSATEALAYYPLQVKNFHKQYHNLLKQYSVEEITAEWSEEDKLVAKEFLDHAEILLTEDKNAGSENRKANYLPFLKKWGGSTIIYRKKLSDSPAYRLNYEELDKAMQEGINFIEQASPIKFNIDNHQHIESAEFSVAEQSKLIKCQTIITATGTKPNNILALESQIDDINFDIQNNFIQPLRDKFICWQGQFNNRNASISYFGDLHPKYAGNVVKAMASAKDGYKIISNEVNQLTEQASMLAKLKFDLTAKIVKVNKLADKIYELVIQAPLAAKNFQPGQFYRLQNYKSSLPSFEGLALTGSEVDKEKGLISTIILEMGGSSDFCKKLSVGEEVILMGPTGSPTKLIANKTYLLVGGGLGNAVLFSIGKALRAMNSKVIYFAGYKKAQDIYKQQQIEQAADIVIYCCDERKLPTNRPQDLSFHGNIIQAIQAYAEHQLCDKQALKLDQIDSLITIGSHHMMAALNKARATILKKHLPSNYEAIASINSPMQCMMKNICAQCLQAHKDANGNISYVYSCVNQDQDMNKVDFEHLDQRLKQNSLAEKITKKHLKLKSSC